MLAILGCTGIPGKVVPFVPHSNSYKFLPRPVPLEDGDSYDCGAECIYGVLQYYGQTADFKEIWQTLYLPGVKGTFPQKLIQSARTFGLQPRILEGSLQTIQSSIDSGIPSIIMIQIRPGLNHFLIPTGYHPRGEQIVCNFYQGYQWILSAEDLQNAWKPCGNLQIELLYDPLATNLQKAQLLESQGQYQQALVIYQEVLVHDPSHFLARKGAGNCLALMGDYTGARKEYLQALAQKTDDPELLNNIAEVCQTLQVDLKKSRVWAEQAVKEYRTILALETNKSHRTILERKQALALGTLGSAWLIEENFAQALASFEESLELLAEKDLQLQSRRMKQIIFCCEKLGKTEKANQFRSTLQKRAWNQQN